MNITFRKIIKNTLQIGVYFFALVGLSFVFVYFGMKWGLTKTDGLIDRQTELFISNSTKKEQAFADVSTSSVLVEDFCKVKTLTILYPNDARHILLAYQKNKDQKLFSQMARAYSYTILDDEKFVENYNPCLKNTNEVRERDIANLLTSLPNATTLSWADDEEWQALSQAIVKDQKLIDQVSKETGVPPRLLITPLVVEQLRLFNSEREEFKKFFSPLKILGSQTQFSWGLYGMKDVTASQVEQNLKDKNSPYYLGEKYEHMLDFKTEDIQNERFARITDSRNHYYSHLYTALYLKELMTAWSKAGHDISSRPEILATLYNIGFAHSKPNATPNVGGAEITVGEKTYTFGALAYQFYYSNELIAEFPYLSNK